MYLSLSKFASFAAINGDLLGMVNSSMFNTIQDRLLEQAVKAKVDLVNTILKQLLERDPTEEDFKKVTLFVYPPAGFNKEDIAYDGYKLGIIEFIIKGNVHSYIFTPVQERHPVTL